MTSQTEIHISKRVIFARKRGHIMKKAVLAVLIAAFVTAVIYAVPANGETEIYNKVVRLHVIANSDSEEDQALKLAVRDAILEKVSSATENCRSREEAENVISSMLPEIVKQAEKTLRDNGSDYRVSALIGKENYPTREYGDIKLPAGNYSSLRVMIGKAEGKNWWCVLFPPLCTGTAKPDDTLIAAGFTPGEVRILTDSESPEYVLKFRILEIFGSLFS